MTILFLLFSELKHFSRIEEINIMLTCGLYMRWSIFLFHFDSIALLSLYDIFLERITCLMVCIPFKQPKHVDRNVNYMNLVVKGKRKNTFTECSKCFLYYYHKCQDKSDVIMIFIWQKILFLIFFIPLYFLIGVKKLAREKR